MRTDDEHEAGLRRLRARAAAFAMYPQHDSRETSRPGREAFLARFEREVEPDGLMDPDERARRALAARKAYFTRLAVRSAAVRRARR